MWQGRQVHVVADPALPAGVTMLGRERIATGSVLTRGRLPADGRAAGKHGAIENGASHRLRSSC